MFFTEYVIALIILAGPQNGTIMLARDLDVPSRSMTFETLEDCEAYRTEELPARQGWMERLPERVTTKTYCLPVRTESV